MRLLSRHFIQLSYPCLHHVEPIGDPATGL